MATKAIELDSSLAEAHTSLGLATLFYDWNWQKAESAFKRAIGLNWNNPTCHQWYAEYLMAIGHPRRCLAEVRRAQQLDPLSLGIDSHLGWGLYFGRQFNQAVEQLEKTLELDPNYTLANFILGQSYVQCAKFEQAIAALKMAASLSGRLPSVLSSLGFAYALAGDKARALDILNELHAQMAVRYVSAYDIALMHTGLDQKDVAFEWLDRALEERSSWMIWLNVEPMLDSLRSDSRFGHLVRMVGLPLKDTHSS